MKMANEDTQPLSIGDIAADLTEAGLWVFPCKADKRPLTRNGFKNAVGTPDEALALFNKYPAAALIGVKTGTDSGILVLDFDTYKGPEAGEYLAELEAQGLLPPTRVHETKKGGLHYIYSSAFGYPELAPHEGVDVKGDGGYIIWWDGFGGNTLSEGIAAAPEALIRHLQAKKVSAQEGTIAQLKAAIMRADNLHDNLNRLAAKYAAAGKSATDIMQDLLEALRGSVASTPHHERHVRWRDLLEDKGGELSRIVISANNKYNPQAASERFTDEVPPDVFSKMEDTASAFFKPIPKGGEGEEAAPTYDGMTWPFDGEGYFAHATHDLLNQRFIMHPFLCEDESVLIAAEPKTGKTALSLTIGLHVACGLDLGESLRVAEPRSVLYFGLEGKRSIRLRIAAWRRLQEKNGVTLPEEIPMFVIERGHNLMLAEVKADFVAKVVAAEAFLKSNDKPALGVIFVDTLTKAMAGGDQNSVEDTSSMFEVVGLLREAKVVATVVFIHHKGKAGTVRGSSNIEADPDVLSSVSKQGNEVTLRIDRARSVEEGGAYSFAMNNFDLGLSSQGFMINAPVVEAVSFSADSIALNAALINKKIFEVIIALGVGRHTTATILNALFKVGIGPADKSKGVKTRALSAISPEADAFFNSLFPTFGEARIVGDKQVEPIYTKASISAVFVR